MAFRVSFGELPVRGKIQMGGGEEYKNGKTPQQLIDVFQNGKHTGLTVFLYYMRPGTGDICRAERREALPGHPPEEGRAILQQEKGKGR